MEPEARPLLPYLPMDDPRPAPTGVRLARTLGLGLCDPMGFFRRVAAGSGFAGPVGFMLVMSLPAQIVLFFLPRWFGRHAADLRSFLVPVDPPVQALRLLVLVLALGSLQVLALAVTGLVQSALLRLWGVGETGPRQDLRAWFYLGGFMTLACWAPGLIPCALFLAGVAGAGFAALHGARTWRGLAAALTWIVPVALVLVAGEVRDLPSQRTGRGDRGVGGPLAIRPGLAPEEILDRHVDQARILANDYGHGDLTPEAVADRLLDQLPKDYPPCFNPYDRTDAAFRLGPPRAKGQVGLIPLHNYVDARTHLRISRGLAIEAWTEIGVHRYLVSLD